jgi:hypothetical protein
MILYEHILQVSVTRKASLCFGNGSCIHKMELSPSDLNFELEMSRPDKGIYCTKF